MAIGEPRLVAQPGNLTYLSEYYFQEPKSLIMIFVFNQAALLTSLLCKRRAELPPLRRLPNECVHFYASLPAA